MEDYLKYLEFTSDEITELFNSILELEIDPNHSWNMHQFSKCAAILVDNFFEHLAQNSMFENILNKISKFGPGDIGKTIAGCFYDNFYCGKSFLSVQS